VAKLRQLTTVVEQLDKQITALKNQLEALSRMPVVEPEVLKSVKRLIGQLEKEKNQLEKKAQHLVKENYAESYKALTSIPGIGPKAATLLIIITGNFSRFEHYKQLVAYVGLSPRVFQSGTSVKGKGHICKMGASRIRRVLYMCTWSAKKANSHCKDVYQRLLAKGKPEKVIKIALANKLLRQAFAIGKKMCTYDKNYQPKFAF
jgi:transposase